MICLITPTGGRPAQFTLCEKYMQRQTYKGKVIWIIIDDCIPRTTNVKDNFKENWEIRKIYPVPIWRKGMNTQGMNIKTGIDFIKTNYSDTEAIFIIEDDDYYKPQYLERMMNLFHYKVLGEINTVYYNVLYRTYFINHNTSHVSLFQIAFKYEMITLFETCLGERFIDFIFYTKLHSQGFIKDVGFFNENNLALGMKGMPGRAGIGAGHGRSMQMLPDPQMNYLISQIGEDYKNYEAYYVSQRPLFVTR
jgi:hypothetical protein